jgi:hypothetical protein
MSVNGKFKDIRVEDLLEMGDRFAIGTAKSVIARVRSAMKEWPKFGANAGLSEIRIQEIQAKHWIL